MTVAQPQQAPLQAPERIPNEIIMSLESASLKIPFELARHFSRANQRILEKDLPGLINAFKEKANDAGIEERFNERLAGLRSRVGSNYEKETEYLRKLEFRQQYIDSLLKTHEPKAAQYLEWLDFKLRRLVVEYYLDLGSLDFATTIIPSLDVARWVDVEVYSDRLQILGDLQARSFQSALQWCSDFKQSLKKTKSSLEFMLRRQEMIEIASTKADINEAIAYGQKYLYSWLSSLDDGDAEGMWEMAETAMAIVVYDNPDEIGRSFADTVRQFQCEYNQMYNLSSPSMLLTVLRAGLTLLKTPTCGLPDYYNINCPACQPELARLAADLPYAHHDNSILVCRITGERMNEDNPPMAMPNGNVYSLRGLVKYSGDGARLAKCPRTGSEYPWEDLRKVYIT